MSSYRIAAHFSTIQHELDEPDSDFGSDVDVCSLAGWINAAMTSAMSRSLASWGVPVHVEVDVHRSVGVAEPPADGAHRTPAADSWMACHCLNLEHDDRPGSSIRLW